MKKKHVKFDKSAELIHRVSSLDEEKSKMKGGRDVSLTSISSIPLPLVSLTLH